MTTVSLNLAARDALARLAHGARIHWALGGHSITLQAPGSDGTAIGRDVFQTLRDLNFIEVTVDGPQTATWYSLSTVGVAWCNTHTPVGEHHRAADDPATRQFASESVRLSPTARDAVLRMAHGATIIHNTATQVTVIGTPRGGYTTVRRPVFDRFLELAFLAVDEQLAHSVSYGLSTAGIQWANANIGMAELPATVALANQPRPITRRPVCSAPPVPFEDDPQVCDRCGNLVGSHPSAVDPAVERRITEAMWRVVIALGGPHDSWSEGPDEAVAAHFRAHMAGCGIDWQSTQRPAMDDVGCTQDSEHNFEKQMMAGWLTCLCRKYLNVHITVRDFTAGQLMWHVAHIDDAPPLAGS